MADTPTPTQLELFGPARRGAGPPTRGEPRDDPRGHAVGGRGQGHPAAGDGGHQRLLRRLDELTDGLVARLVLTRNRSRILSARPAAGDPRRQVVRLDACFTTAPDEVVAAVALWLTGGPERRREALALIRRHFEASREAAEEPPARRRRTVLRPVGRTLDLRQMRDELNRTYFDGRLEVGITWGRAARGAAWRQRGRRRQGRRSIRLGSYSYETNVIRIHRALDHPGVPRYVVAAIVYHEMLHAALPEPARRGGRRRLHTPEFRRRERRFARHDAARAWVEEHLDELLARR